MSDIKMYDILGQFNGLNTKSVPASASQTEPLYESVEPLDSVTESVTVMESKFAAFKENMVAEKTKRKSAEPKDDPENIDSADATIQNLLTKARFSRPGAKSDLEAIVYHIAKQDEELERAKNAEHEDRELIKKAQAVTDQMNNRFKKLNAKVAAGQITAQDKAQAQAAQQIEKDADAARDAVAANPTAPVQNIAEPEVKVEPPIDQEPDQPTTTPQPTSNVVDFPTTDIPPAADSEKSKVDNRPSKITSINTPKKKQQPIIRKAPGLDVFKDIAAESLTEESRYPEGTPEAGKYNWGLLAKAWQNKLPYVDLDFGLRTVRITDAQMYAALATWRANGVDFKAGGDPSVDNALSSRENLEIFFRGRKFKDFLSAYPKVKEKALKATQGAKPGVTARVNPNVPSGTQEDLPLAEQNLGNKTMTKPNSIIEAVRSVEDKKLRESAKPDFLDLDKDGDTDEPMKSAAKDAKKHEPADVDKDAVAKRKRLQALKDKQEDERTEKDDDYKSASRFVKGRAYGGSAQKDDEDDLDETQEIRFPKDDWSKNDSMVEPITSKQAMDQHSDYFDKKVKLDPKTGKPIDEGRMKDIYTDMEAIFNKKGYSSRKQLTPADYDELAKPHGISGKELAVALGHKKVSQVEEVAPPGAKAERMVKHIKKGYSKDGNLTKREKGIAYATAWKAHNKGQVEEATNFGDTIKNSEGKMTKVKVTEGKDAIRNHPIYTTKEAWDHYAQELAEQEAMDEAVMAPAVNVQQELDEIAKLAGLPTRACEACNCAPCKCDEGLEAMAPSDSSSPLTHAELDEAASRKDFRMVANLIKSNPDREKAKELAHHHADIFKQQNPRFKREMFLSACGLEECGAMPTAVIVGEDEMEEGNEFSGALAAAKASGAKDFEVGGKKYTVKEDININVTANGEEDVVNLIRKLSGMEAIKTVTDKISAMSGEACGACGSSPCGCEAVAETVEDGPKERDVEYTNSPREEQAGSDAAFPGGTDLNRPKKSYSDKPYRGDNPMAVAEAKEEALWKSYETMINDVKA